jgi:hypothetical protein
MERLCNELPVEQIAKLRQQGKRCFISAEGVRITIETRHTPPEPARDAESDPVAGTFGVAALPDDLPCETVEDLDSLGEADLFSGDAEAPPSAERALADLIDRLASYDAPLVSGLEALPIARRVLDVLRRRDPERLPAQLPTELELTLMTAPKAYADALALERLEAGDPREQQQALRALSSGVGREAVPLLQLEVRAAARQDRASIVSAALLALLHSDRRVARLEALPLLGDTHLRRAAIGVFALADPELAAALTRVDVEDGQALALAARTVLEWVAVGDNDEGLRVAARAILDGE